MGCSEKRVRFDTARLEEIKESITKADIKSLVDDKAITQIPKKGVSRGRANKIQSQKRKGRRKGHGSRKGTLNARDNKKDMWMAKIRLQRKTLKQLKDKGLITDKAFRLLYLKAKGGFFRSVRHINLYITERNLVKKNEQGTSSAKAKKTGR